MQDDKDKESGGKGGDRSKQAAKSAPPNQLAETTRAAAAAAIGPIPVSVSFGPKFGPLTPDDELWREIQNRLLGLSFNEYSSFIDSVLCDAGELFLRPGQVRQSAGSPTYRDDLKDKLKSELRAHLFGPDAYALLYVATECFLQQRACLVPTDFQQQPPSYLVNLPQGRVLPYLNLIRQRLTGIPVGDPGSLGLGTDEDCYTISNQRLFAPCFLELIWSYWHEQGMLVQSINAIAIRYQNIRQGRGRDPLGAFELDPLRSLNNLMWGYLQDEQRRLSVVRRAYEYDHHYGLRLYGKAIPEFRPADTRAKFLPAFHELLYQTHVFYRDDDIATVQADPFPVVNALRELHFILTEGMHNQFGDLPSQARVEMLIQQWLLARPEMREFLRGRVMVPYPELWMDSVDTMKTLQGWTDVPSLYFNELAVTGEQLLLSVRYADWATQTPTTLDAAANWARFHRSVVRRYMWALKMVTDVDLTVDRVEIQSAQARYGQPPIRMRVAPPRAPAQLADRDLDLLAPPESSGRALLPTRTFNRGYKR